MALLYKRRYELLIGNGDEGLLITSTGNVSASPDGKKLVADPGDQQAFRIAFLVQHDYGDHQQFAEIQIFGLSGETEKRIYSEFRTVSLQAGYQQLYGPIFKGQLINIERGRSGADKYVRLFCTSGGKQIAQTYVNLVFAQGVPLNDMIRRCAETFGKPVIFIGDFNEQRTSDNHVFNGGTVSVLKRLSKIHGFRWAIEEDAVYIIRNGQTRDGEIFRISSTSGMIDSPKVTETAVIADMSLMPSLRIGSRIKIESANPKFVTSGNYWYEIPRSIGEGIYSISRLVHSGDSHGNAWRTQVECLRLDRSATLSDWKV